MTAFPIFYAVIENDLRRVLSYSMINQIGFMVVGIGLGTALSINGAVAHAFNDVIFKGLLMMSMGAVLYRTGKIKGTDLGGLYKSMPLTATFSMVGAASISAFPLFSGFVSKSMVMAAALEGGHTWVWVLLLFASAGVVEHAGIKIPFFSFFAHDSGIRTKEAPDQHAPGHGAGGRSLHRHRDLPAVDRLSAAALPGGVPSLRCHPRHHPAPAPLLLVPRGILDDADRVVSTGEAVCEPGFRLELPLAGAQSGPGRRGSGDLPGWRLPALRHGGGERIPSGSGPAPGTRERALPALPHRIHGALGIHPPGCVSSLLLPLGACPRDGRSPAH